jgi:hypothetical protein
MGEGAVADLAPSRRAEALDLAGGEGREVVVEHEVAIAVALERLELLLVVLGAEGRRDEGLGLAPREEGGSVGSGQVADLGPDGTDFLDAAPVDADALVHDEPPDFGLLDLLEVLVRLGLHRRLVRHVIHRHEMDPGRLEGGRQRFGARLLLVDGERFHHAGSRHLLHLALQGGIGPRLGVESPARLGRLRHQLLLDARELLALLVAEGEGLEHLVLRDLLAARLDHEDRFLGARHDDLESGRRLLGIRRIHHQLAVDHGDTRAAPMGPANGMPESERAAEVPIMASTSGSFSLSAEMTRLITWISLRKPLGKSGAMGRSMRRQVSVPSRPGRPSRLKKPPGIFPPA